MSKANRIPPTLIKENKQSCLMIHLKKRNNHESNLEKEECAHQICSTFNIFIKEKMNQEYIFENNNQEKKE